MQSGLTLNSKCVNQSYCSIGVHLRSVCKQRLWILAFIVFELELDDAFMKKS